MPHMRLQWPIKCLCMSPSGCFFSLYFAFSIIFYWWRLYCRLMFGMRRSKAFFILQQIGCIRHESCSILHTCNTRNIWLKPIVLFFTYLFWVWLLCVCFFCSRVFHSQLIDIRWTVRQMVEPQQCDLDLWFDLRTTSKSNPNSIWILQPKECGKQSEHNTTAQACIHLAFNICSMKLWAFVCFAARVPLLIKI